MPGYIHGLHDPGGESTMLDAPGWIVHTVALLETQQQDYTPWKNQGFGNVVRLNYGYHPHGTIPSYEKYAAFAGMCADFVRRSPGIDYVIIGNEPNHLQEWPNGQKIEASQYAKCFDLCYKAIAGVNPGLPILTAAVAPWNDSAGDWTSYYQTMLTAITRCDGFAIHAYTHGSDPNLIYSEQMVNGWYWHFYVYRQTIGLIPNHASKFPIQLPVFITESNQGDIAWADANSGWVKNAMGEIDYWNTLSGKRRIHALCLYRWPNYEQSGDKWGIENKPGVIADFKESVNFRYEIPSAPPKPAEPEPAPEPDPLPMRDIDPALKARGVTFTFVTPTAGTWYWRITKATHLNKQEAIAVGPDHHILGTVKKNGVETGGVPFVVTWPSGATTIYSKPNDPNGSFNYDYGMSKSLNEYAIVITEGAPSDAAAGIGMGAHGNPAEHTSTWIEWEWVQAQGEPIPAPEPEAVMTGYVNAPDGLNVRKGPGTSFAALGTLTFGSTVLYERPSLPPADEWLHMIEGWVKGEYVSRSQVISAAPPNLPTIAITHPLPNALITQHWGEAAPEYVPGMWGHNGVDFGGKPSGTSVICFSDGVVTRSERDVGYGHFVMVSHAAIGMVSLYAHLDEPGAPVGQVLNLGEILGFVGSTGNSTGPHLHFELRKINPDGSYVHNSPMPDGRLDPESWCCEHGLFL